MNMNENEVELTILMPCLNEEETIATCIEKSQKYLRNNRINGEVLISDNGSTDRSSKIAEKMGARVCYENVKGYGSALIKGIKEARGKYVIMGDCDDSYDFLNLNDMLSELRNGYQLVMGNRFKGGIEKGAMPFSHKYIGNPMISMIGRFLYKTNIGDFNCGLRGFDRSAILKLNLKATGMEYASEMIVESVKHNFRITEVPVTLKKDGRTRKPHLRTIRDGIRHLRYLLMNVKK